ncbi:hypothetical protein L1987_02744 [Smallanthus sonchifolius]|uniref:Uncharacterized protein n=1 Tax=Smallanthus sonchifolius TaxID=185202 RepID=A0ACB9K8P6_9ASTR|nr:hypothetical protein L1987_02744 [Smallanthus sonchifolius]
MLNYDNEIGTPQKPPKLLNIPIIEGYKHPTHIYLDEEVPKPISKLDEEQKKAYDREKKALASITMSLTRELFHSFRGYDTSKDLWKTLQKRFEGNSDIKKSKRDLLWKQYECFNFMENKSLDDLISRFYHLQTDMKAFELKYPDEELVEKFLDALPPKFEMYTTLMRENPKFYELTVDEAIGKIQAHNMNLMKKESSGRPQIQDPSMHHGTTSTSKSSGSGIALFTGHSNEEDHLNGCGGHACYASGSGLGTNHQHTSRNPPATSSANHSAIVKIAEDHVALFSSCMLAYENFIGGKLTDPETIEEDFNQVDPDDIEDMDIQAFPEQNRKKVGLMAEIMELMEAERKEAEEMEASVAVEKESTTAVALMSIGEAQSSSSEQQVHLDIAYRGLEKRNNEINKLQNENLQLKCTNEKLKNSCFVVEHYESVVRKLKGLGLGTKAIPPPISGKFVNSLLDIDLTCLDESSDKDDSPKKDESSSKANSTSSEEYVTASEDGSVNTCPEGVVSEELLTEQKVHKNIITNGDNCILIEPDIIETNDKLKRICKKYYTPKNQTEKGQTSVHKPTPPAHNGELSKARSNEPYKRTHVDKRMCFHCGMVGLIFVNCSSKNQGKWHVVSQPVVIPKSPTVKPPPRSPKQNVVKPPVQPMGKPKIKSEAKPSVARMVKLPAVPRVSTSGSTRTGEKSVARLSKPQRRRRNKRLRKLEQLTKTQSGEASTSSPAVVEPKSTVLVKNQKRSWNKKVKGSQSPVPNSSKDSPILNSYHDCELKEVVYFEKDGRPKTTMAWVSKSN